MKFAELNIGDKFIMDRTKYDSPVVIKIKSATSMASGMPYSFNSIRIEDGAHYNVADTADVKKVLM